MRSKPDGGAAVAALPSRRRGGAGARGAAWRAGAPDVRRYLLAAEPRGAGLRDPHAGPELRRARRPRPHPPPHVRRHVQVTPAPGRAGPGSREAARGARGAEGGRVPRGVGVAPATRRRRGAGDSAQGAFWSRLDRFGWGSRGVRGAPSAVLSRRRAR